MISKKFEVFANQNGFPANRSKNRAKKSANWKGKSYSFKKPLDEENYNQFVYDNIRNLTSKDYIIWYRISKEEGKRKDDMDYGLAEQMTEESFPLICQHYISSFLYSEQGKNNPGLWQLHNTKSIYSPHKACIFLSNFLLQYIVIYGNI